VTTLTRALVVVAALLLPSLAFGLTKADEPIKPVTVCDILSDPAQFSGKNVAVIGIGTEYRNDTPSWLTANGCRVRVECCRVPAPNPLVALDQPVLVEKLKQARGSAPPDANRTWDVFYGRVETREQFEKEHGVGAFVGPVQLLFKGGYGLYFGDDGSHREVVIVGSPGIILTAKEPFKTTVCELVEQPAHYQGKAIEFRSAISLSGEDAPLTLSDGGCSTPARFEVVDPLPDESRNSYQSLNSYVAQDRVVEATVLGRVWQTVVLNGESYFRITLQRVSDVAAK